MYNWTMNQELVRINTTDNIEQPGILYTPTTPTNKIVIHVHGLNGNFYENRFLDPLAKAYIKKGCAFLTFNNRGRDFISELHQGTGYAVIGGSYERFKDCLMDIDGVVNWAKEKGFSEIILEGHSYGCNKVLYYYNQRKDDIFKKLVLLAPCDIPSETKMFLGEEYERVKAEATKCVEENKGRELLDYPIMANGKIAAGTFYYDFLPGGENDFLRYREGAEAKNELLNAIDIPVLVIFGDEDKCVLTQPAETIKSYLANNIKNCDVEVIAGTGHSYRNKFDELARIIENN